MSMVSHILCYIVTLQFNNLTQIYTCGISSLTFYHLSNVNKSRGLFVLHITTNKLSYIKYKVC